MTRVRFLRPDGTLDKEVDAPAGNRLLELGQAEGQPLEGTCEGQMACSTCHVIVDPADIPSVVDPDPSRNVLLWSMCNGANNGRSRDAECSIVLKYGMRRDFNQWLASLGPTAPVKSLTELREWNTAHRDDGAIQFGQANLDISDEMDVERDRGRYEGDRAKDLLIERGLPVREKK